MNAPVTVMKTAGEGGPWGMAVLASYMLKNRGEGLADYLTSRCLQMKQVRRWSRIQRMSEDLTPIWRSIKEGLQVEAAAVESLLF